MTSPTPSGVMTAILPCNNLDASERFYNRLGFARPDSERPAPGEADTYRRRGLHRRERTENRRRIGPNYDTGTRTAAVIG
jgi:hypothetical protein